jgi:hypothetical protein
MTVLRDNSTRLPIKPTKDEPRCTELGGLSWPTPCPIALPSGAEAVIAIAIRSPGACESCVGLDRVGLLRRAPAGALRADRIVLTCAGCGARFTRLDGSL